MFTDANLAHSGTWRLGAIYRDRNREVLASATWRMQSFEDPTMVEAMALYKST
jgi:hypothetical protein